VGQVLRMIQQLKLNLEVIFEVLWVFRTNVTADFGIVTGNFGPS
jgi:hypothetical protein